MDLQGWVVEEVAGLAGARQDTAGELAGRLVDAVGVGGGGGSADVFAGAQAVFGVGEFLQPQQPGLEGVLVGKAGGVGP
ncbi:hypothetical protein ACFVXQ_28130 [Kitasatospora sp. NPDC058263]